MIFSEKPLMLAFPLKICSSMVVSTNPSQGMRIKRRRLALAMNSMKSTLPTLGRMTMRPWLSNESNFESRPAHLEETQTLTDATARNRNTVPSQRTRKCQAHRPARPTSELDLEYRQ
jgi:hypothetical protein